MLARNFAIAPPGLSRSDQQVSRLGELVRSFDAFRLYTSPDTVYTVRTHPEPGDVDTVKLLLLRAKERIRTY
jgi:hypothetical protein